MSGSKVLTEFENIPSHKLGLPGSFSEKLYSAEALGKHCSNGEDSPTLFENQ